VVTFSFHHGFALRGGMEKRACSLALQINSFSCR
jgi:hypothetical protein